MPDSTTLTVFTSLFVGAQFTLLGFMSYWLGKNKRFDYRALGFKTHSTLSNPEIWAVISKDAGARAPHGLRKRFRTWGMWTNPEIAEYLLGHIGGLKAIYAQYGDESMIQEVIKAYLGAEPNLTIMGASEDRISAQADRIVEMESTIEDLQKMVLGLNTYIDSIKGQMEPHLESTPVE